ncbi:MAG: GntR family transcriptional regulator [Pseudomonadota bacterium]
MGSDAHASNPQRPDPGTASGDGSRVPTATGPKLSRTQDAYHSLRRLILDNELPPGRRMFEQEVADFLHMSRTPVREALIRLAEEGLVDVRPRHGMTVLPISPADMNEIYDVLTSLEGGAAELLAETGISGPDLSRLRACVDAMDSALAAEDRRAWALADDTFHRTLVELTGNRRLIQLVEGMWDQTHRARIATLSARPLPTTSNQDHRDLVDAIAAGNAEKARSIHVQHRRKARDLLVKLLTDLGIEGA